ncbi:KilA-N domain-containing protein [Haliscomenobacter hydrossis]|uniref:KilA, /APSES-type HTH DNA-binding domain protein n=1 Tax=Haliscomenobacter hydrossis (strain ATCC 27775 / DSM 1100 / LMG 10767 / O) TaxID=760192 RepID=F4L7X5_HALH1|nr:KilA-N domain-containing protein [Haliscomenobacter hydrossis]AEE54483.1 KilA, /APSES-type HTH DNA-binding domain protein [Haliscomenobacter hydrossis DSM 1100]
MSKSKLITVKGIGIATLMVNGEDFISLTDIARNKNPDEPKDVVKNWLRSKTTIEFIGLWEQLNNPDFKGVEFDAFLFEAGSNAFTLSPSKWIEKTNAIGLVSKQGNNGGTFAHKDIAFEFASWVSAGFKLYLIKEFQRLKDDENDRLKLEWNLQRTLAKVNYQIHTDAIKENLIPQELSKQQTSFVYANEADLLNMALFGMTAKQWRDANPKATGNIRDAATLEQLVVLSNLESINAVLIHQGLPQSERLIQLNKIAITQMKSLLNSKSMKKLK